MARSGPGPAGTCRVTRETLTSVAYLNRRAGKLEQRLERILAHIGSTCTESLTLEGVASFAGMTASSFARFFRNMTGRTFIDYRNSCRIERAVHLLDETDRSIVDIAYASGFQSLPSFNRDFRKRIGQSPPQLPQTPYSADCPVVG